MTPIFAVFVELVEPPELSLLLREPQAVRANDATISVAPTRTTERCCTVPPMSG
jgi:hypothetical protein